MIRVLVVDDDPMVAEINRRYVEMVPGFQCVGVAARGDEALRQLEALPIDLVLLDIFMPGDSGLDVLQQIRSMRRAVDVMVITAASDIASIQEALRLGAVDCLIKPFEFERFRVALGAYQRERSVLRGGPHLSQRDLDEWILRRRTAPPPAQLPKGITKATLQHVVEAIDRLEDASFTTDTLAASVGISRVSMRKYLYFLQSLGVLTVELEYRSVGRPSFRYRFNPARRTVVAPYLET
ncbi:MAG: response regulator [Alicyclobacillus sp.]|nr:response regulator [Alicyclobacillus sp.]